MQQLSLVVLMALEDIIVNVSENAIEAETTLWKMFYEQRNRKSVLLQAKHVYRSLLLYAPKLVHSQLYLHLGDVYRYLGDNKTANQCYQQSMTIQPTSLGHIRLALMAEMNQDPIKAHYHLWLSGSMENLNIFYKKYDPQTIQRVDFQVNYFLSMGAFFKDTEADVLLQVEQLVSTLEPTEPRSRLIVPMVLLITRTEQDLVGKLKIILLMSTLFTWSMGDIQSCSFICSTLELPLFSLFLDISKSLGYADKLTGWILQLSTLSTRKEAHQSLPKELLLTETHFHYLTRFLKEQQLVTLPSKKQLILDEKSCESDHLNEWLTSNNFTLILPRAFQRHFRDGMLLQQEQETVKGDYSELIGCYFYFNQKQTTKIITDDAQVQEACSLLGVKTLRSNDVIQYL